MSKTQLNLFDTLSEKFQKKLKKITHKTSKNKDNLSLKGWLLSYSNMDDEEPLTNKNVYTKVIGFVNEFLSDYELPGNTEIKFDRLRNASYIDNTFEKLDSADVALNVEFQTLSGIKVRAEMTVPIKNGEFVEPSILFIDGNSRIISQTTFDDITKKGTFTRKVFKNPEDIVTPDMLKTYQDVELPVVSMGMYSSSKNIMDRVAEHQLAKSVDERIQTIRYGTSELNAVNKYIITYETKIAKTNQNWNYDDLYDYVVASIKKEGMSIDSLEVNRLISKALFRSNQDTHKEVKQTRISKIYDYSYKEDSKVWELPFHGMTIEDLLSIQDEDLQEFLYSELSSKDIVKTLDNKYFAGADIQDYLPEAKHTIVREPNEKIVMMPIGKNQYALYSEKQDINIAIGSKEDMQTEMADLIKNYGWKYASGEINLYWEQDAYNADIQSPTIWEDYGKKISNTVENEYYFVKQGWNIITPAGIHSEIEHPDGGTMWVETDIMYFWIKSHGLEHLETEEFDKIHESFKSYIIDNTDLRYAFFGVADEKQDIKESKVGMAELLESKEQIKFYKWKKATGEPDQEYDHTFFDAIVRQLERYGFSEATYREFDKYQGVYLRVPGVDTFWVTDVYYTGEKAEEDVKKPYTKAILVDTKGNTQSANKGDYYYLPNEYIFEDFVLKLTKQDGTVEAIEHPTVAQLPDITEVMSTFTYKPGTETEIYVFSPEHNSEIELEVTNKDGIVNASALIEYCEQVKKTSNKKEKKADVQQSQAEQIEEWAKNIADNYNQDIDTNIYSALIDASKDLGLPMEDIDRRWQYFSAGDNVSSKDIQYLLMGKQGKESGYISEDRTEGRPPTKDSLAGGSSEELMDAIVGDNKEELREANFPQKWHGEIPFNWDKFKRKLHTIGEQSYKEGMDVQEWLKETEEILNKLYEQQALPYIPKMHIDEVVDFIMNYADAIALDLWGGEAYGMESGKKQAVDKIPEFLLTYTEENPTYEIIDYGDDWILAVESGTLKAVFAYGFDTEGYMEMHNLADVGKDYQDIFKNAIEENALEIEEYAMQEEDTIVSYDTLVKKEIEKESKNALWKDKLQNVYESLEDFKHWDEIYGLVERLGFETAEEAWEANPMIQGSVYPEDYKIVGGGK